MTYPVYTTQDIVASRPSKNVVDPRRAYAALVEPEYNAQGEVVDVATLFLSNSECPFHCLMCDLWQNTLDRRAPSADIVEQIRSALSALPAAKEIKLYNSGNFFDPKAIPREQFEDIARLVRGFETVIVENHPELIGEECLRFRDLIAPAQLEVALGLETCHPDVLAALNKQMTLDEFEQAVTFLHSHQIRTRAFILLRPPFMTEDEGIEWALKSMKYAFDLNMNCCSVIPTRATNGIMQQLEAKGEFSPPSGSSMESVLARGMELQRGRVFIDLWDAEKFFPCPTCRLARIKRLQRMNLSQQNSPAIECPDCHPHE